MKCAVDYTDDMMVTFMNMVSQKPTEVMQATVGFKQEGSSPQECVGRGHNAGRWEKTRFDWNQARQQTD